MIPYVRYAIISFAVLENQTVLLAARILIVTKMPRAYSQDLRWRAIWLTEILGFDINEVSILLQMSRKTISRYLQKFQRLGHVKETLRNGQKRFVEFGKDVRPIFMTIVI